MSQAWRSASTGLNLRKLPEVEWETKMIRNDTSTDDVVGSTFEH